MKPNKKEVDYTATTGANRQLGKFIVDAAIITDKRYHLVLKHMNFVPTRVEMQYADGTFIYVGYSELFDPSKPGEMVPIYEIYCDSLLNKGIRVRVERVQGPMVKKLGYPDLNRL